LTCLLLIGAPALAQTTNREPQAGTEQKQSDKIREADLIEAERRTFAISSLTSLANEARSYDDLTLRTRVLARVADALWEVDAVTARSLFRKAWEAAETGDAQEPNPGAVRLPTASQDYFAGPVELHRTEIIVRARAKFLLRRAGFVE